MQHTQPTGYYFAPPSHWPVVGSTAIFFLAWSAVLGFNGYGVGWISFVIGAFTLLYMLFGWFGTVIRESEGGLFNNQVDLSFRWAMSWFIFSEVMFFGAFFTALWWMRAHSVPALGGLENSLLWPDFKAVWPSVQPGATASPANIIEPFQTMTPFWLPTINTALLLTSGVTLTIAHHLLREGKRGPTIFWMWITVLLGATFGFVQGYEYFHAYTEMNLKLSSGIFGSTFFMLTGFHGFHVFVGAIMLSVVLLRLLRGHFKPNQHFAFEAAAWYWHFVDVVWIGLYIVVYWL